MKPIPTTLLLLLLVAVTHPLARAADEADSQPARPELAELDAYWSEVSRAVGAGDFEGYTATCHPEGVLVAGTKKTSHPLKDALARWKQGFLDTKEGRMKASVNFRFSQRLGDSSTAHETGIFHYATEKPDGETTSEFIHFEGLLVKRDGRWLILMEYQKSVTTKAEWDALASGDGK